jgi:outer membrane immunogenic protein
MIQHLIIVVCDSSGAAMKTPTLGAVTLGAVALSAATFGGAALAADMPLKAPPPAPIFSWLGLYVGVNGGYGWSQSQTVVDTETFNQAFSTSAVAGSRSLGGGFGGVQVGANFYQWNNWLLGVEADFELGDIRGSSAAVVPNFLPGVTANISTSHRVDAFGTARGRIGYAWDSTLLYVTGGFAWGRVNYRFQYADSANFSANQDAHPARAGYVVGGGIEQALTWWDPNLSVKVEYQYINLGTQHFTSALLFNGGIATVFSENQDVRTDFHTVRVGLNYRFSGFDAPPPPRIVTKGPPIPEPVVNWTGLYLGIHAGWMFSHVDAFYPGGNPALQIAGVPGGGYTNHNDNPLVGAHVGLQYQWGPLVAGIEGDWTARLNSNSGHEEVCPKQSIALFNCGSRITEIQTAGARLGWSLGRWLPYLSGGYATALFHGEVTNRSLAPVGTRILWWDDRANGWYAGAGVDWLASPGVVLGIEYRHYDFGSRTIAPTALVGGVPAQLPNDTTKFTLQADTIALRATVKLGPWPAPAVTANY